MGKSNGLDAAIEAAAVQKASAITLALPGGRSATIEFPVPLTPIDALVITSAFSQFFLEQYTAERRATAGGRIIIPS